MGWVVAFVWLTTLSFGAAGMTSALLTVFT